MDTFLSNKDRERIDPAESGLQRELIDEVKKLESATNNVKFQVITLSAGNAQTPASHGCKNVRFWTASGVVSVGDEDGQPVLLKADIWSEIPVNNVGSLRFIATAGATVYIISTN